MPMRLRSELPAFQNVTEWLNGKVTKEELKGRPVLVHFWSISCCLYKESLPLINVWREKYAEQLQVVGVHMPRSEKDMELGPVKDAAAEYEIKHPMIVDHEHTVTDAFQNEFVPAYYLFDGEQQLRHFQAGEKGLKMVEQRLHKLLGVT